MKYLFSILALGLAALAFACGEKNPTTDDPNNGLDDPFNGTTGLELAEKEFGPDPYSIGRDWYIYDGMTHALYPEPWVYVLRGENEITLFEIDSYYNDEGESGFFTLRSKTLRDGEWSDVETYLSEKNVKEENVCLSLSPPGETDCDDAIIILRTAWRAVPQGSLVVNEPALFHRSHFTFENKRSVAVIETESLEETTEDETELRELADVPSAAADPRHARVGWLHDAAGEQPRTDIQIHITSNLHFVQWAASEIVENDGSLDVKLNALCQRSDPNDQTPFLDEETEITINLPTDKSYTGALVQLCDPESDDVVSGDEVDTFTSALVGLWPDAKSFDLIVEQLDGRVTIRIAPGHLLWNWTRGDENGTDEFSPVDLDKVWDEELGRAE